MCVSVRRKTLGHNDLVAAASEQVRALCVYVSV